MTRRILALLLAVLLCLGLFGCAQEPEQTPDKESSSQQEDSREEEDLPEEKEEDKDEDTEEEASSVTPILYKVTDDEGNVAWLFGSIHLGQKDFYPLPEYVMEAFEGSDALAVELDLMAFEKDLKQQVQALQVMLCPAGTTIADYLDAELYAEAVQILKDNGVYQKPYDMYLPVLWMSLIQELSLKDVDASSKYGVDRHMLKLAKEADMPIQEVESAREQYTMLAGLSVPLQALLLEQAMEEYGDPALTADAFSHMLDYWKQGKEKLLQEEATLPDISEDDPQYDLYQEYRSAMYTQRDEKMCQFVQDALDSGEEVFICVGAAHVVGKGAMVDTLKAEGYTVERIVPEQ